MAKTAKAAQIIKKKRWVPIISPKVFNSQPLGETHISEYEEAIGKEITVSLMILTGDPQKQTVSLSFKMVGTSNNAIITQPVAYKIAPVAVRKMMRRGKEKVEDSFILTTQDNIKVIAKPILVTKSRAKGAVLTNLRRTLRANLAKIVASNTFETNMVELVMHRLQKTLSDSLRKIYPLSTCELRVFSIVKHTKNGQKTAEVQQPEQKTEPVKPEEKTEEKTEVQAPAEPAAAQAQ